MGETLFAQLAADKRHHREKGWERMIELLRLPEDHHSDAMSDAIKTAINTREISSSLVGAWYLLIL